MAVAIPAFLERLFGYVNGSAGPMVALLIPTIRAWDRVLDLASVARLLRAESVLLWLGFRSDFDLTGASLLVNNA